MLKLLNREKSSSYIESLIKDDPSLFSICYNSTIGNSYILLFKSNKIPQKTESINWFI